VVFKMVCILVSSWLQPLLISLFFPQSCTCLRQRCTRAHSTAVREKRKQSQKRFLILFDPEEQGEKHRGTTSRRGSAVSFYETAEAALNQGLGYEGKQPFLCKEASAIDDVIVSMGDLSLEARAERHHSTAKTRNALQRLLQQAEDMSRAIDTVLLTQPQDIPPDTPTETEMANLGHQFTNLRRTTETLEPLREMVSQSLQALNSKAQDLARCRKIQYMRLEPISYETGILIDEYKRFNMLEPVVKLMLFVSIAATVLMGVSRDNGDLLLSLLYPTLSLSFPAKIARVLQAQLPRSLRAARGYFDYESKTTTYAACPTCHALYPPSSATTEPLYPRFCLSKSFSDSATCGTELLTHPNGKRHAKCKPVRPFVYHSLFDYIGRLLTDGRLEQHMDECCDKAMSGEQKPEIMEDIWDAEFLRRQEGPISGTLFIDRQRSARLAFSLSFDGFSVEGMRTRSSYHSAGLISMICLNLPPHLRHKTEYVYVAGIVPGPHLPSLTGLNHYLEPLLNDLEAAWTRGIFFTRTALHPRGRLVHAIVACTVTDLLGGRHLSQMASVTSSRPCHVCQLEGTKSTIDFAEIGLKIRDSDVLREASLSWKHAISEKERGRVFKEFGVRWSVMWTLPYWNPTVQLTVDVMHCLLENCTNFHFREVLCLTEKASSSSHKQVAFQSNFSLPSEDQGNIPLRDRIARIHAQLTKPHNELHGIDIETIRRKLKSSTIEALLFVCRDLQLTVDTAESSGLGKRHRKSELIDALAKWVSLQADYMFHSP
jgi:hypothetical protein